MVNRLTTPENVDGWNNLGKDCLPGLFGIEVLSISPNELRARMKVTKQLCAPNGFLHAASVVALADTACGYGNG